MLNLYAVVLILVYPNFLEYYDNSLSNNSCFTKPASHINIIHWWYIKGQLIDMMSIDRRNWTRDRKKSASYDYKQRDKKKVWHLTVHYYFSQHPCPSEHKSLVWLTCTIIKKIMYAMYYTENSPNWPDSLISVHAWLLVWRKRRKKEGRKERKKGERKMQERLGRERWANKGRKGKRRVHFDIT